MSDLCYLRKPRMCCYRPQQSWGKVIFSVACVKNSVHSGEGSAPLHAGIPTWSRHLLEQTPPQDQVLPSAVHVGRYGQQASGTHPTGMHSCFIRESMEHKIHKLFLSKSLSNISKHGSFRAPGSLMLFSVNSAKKRFFTKTLPLYFSSQKWLKTWN